MKKSWNSALHAWHQLLSSGNLSMTALLQETSLMYKRLTFRPIIQVFKITVLEHRLWFAASEKLEN